jgi:hypothetical protein
MKHVLLSTGVAMIVALAAISTGLGAEKGGGGRGGGGGAVSSGAPSLGGGGGGGQGAFAAGNAGSAFRGNAAQAPFVGGGSVGRSPETFRMGRMDRDFDRDFDRHHHRFREDRFAFYGPDYDYSDYGCYERRWVHTSYGWRWLRVRVCY